MRIEILGCSATIGGNRRTTSLLVDGDTLVDAGSGVGELDLDGLLAIRRVFLTHAHLDHSGFLPLLADAGAGRRSGPLPVWALPETIAALKQHMFNGVLWPDYTIRPSPAAPYLTFHPLRVGEPVAADGKTVTPLPARHSIPAVGFALQGSGGSLAFSGDTTYCPEFWEALNGIPELRAVMVETTFLNAQRQEAVLAGHTTPALLARGLAHLRGRPEILITHLEAGHEDQTLAEIGSAVSDFAVTQARRGQILSL